MDDLRPGENMGGAGREEKIVSLHWLQSAGKWQVLVTVVATVLMCHKSKTKTLVGRNLLSIG